MEAVGLRPLEAARCRGVLEVGRIVRCPADADHGRQQTGWYSLHELHTTGGELLLVGAFGTWRDAGGKYKVELKKRELSSEERAAIRARIAEDRRRAEAVRKREAERAAARAQALWARLSDEGDCDYLTRKGVKAYGVKFSARGNLVVPIHDALGVIHGLQVIYGSAEDKARKGRDKDYWPTGLAKRGHYCMLGTPGTVILIAEGYATAASLHEATGRAVAVAFDAGNLAPVAEALRKRYRQAKLLICADDDYATFGNPGVSAASTAALAVSGEVLVPTFEDDPARQDVADAAPLPEERDAWTTAVREAMRGHDKLTDFNDLHQRDGKPLRGLHEVRRQLDARLQELGWGDGSAAGATKSRGGGDKDGLLRLLVTVEELRDRYSIIYGGNATAFDHEEHMLLSLSDIRDACTHRNTYRAWMESSEKRLVRLSEVGFDPTESDPRVKCNLWGGWPTTPKSGDCSSLLDLLAYLCKGEEEGATREHGNAREVYQWVLRWLAYPIQNPGAKMKTSLVFHGKQGVGKNLFFEAVMAIYGEYGRIIDQAALIDKHNDWASRKLFLIADEVVSRQELYHLKGQLKALATGDTIRINPKHVTAHEERNHVNIVYLSNELQPKVLDEDDRRDMVVWTPEAMDAVVYQEAAEDARNGGIEALHDYLLRLDLGDFNPHTKPLMTRAKRELIELGLDSTARFAIAWMGGDIEDVPVCPALSQDMFDLYRRWCSRVGISKPAPMHVLTANLGKRKDIRKDVARYYVGQKQKQATFIFPHGAKTPPDGQTQPNWLTQCADAFRAAVDDYKGARSEF